MKPILLHAIEVEGTRRKLAAALGVSPVTVTGWDKRGLPPGREAQLVRLYGRRKVRKEWKPKGVAQ